MRKGRLRLVSGPLTALELFDPFLLSNFFCNCNMQVLSVIDSNCHNTETEEKEFLGSKETKVADKKLELEMTFAEVIKIHLPFVGISLISSSPQVN